MVLHNVLAKLTSGQKMSDEVFKRFYLCCFNIDKTGHHYWTYSEMNKLYGTRFILETLSHYAEFFCYFKSVNFKHSAIVKILPQHHNKKVLP